MSWPSNDTGLSLAGVLKWLAIIVAAVFLVHAYQGLILKEGATGSIRNAGMALTGSHAVRWGWANLGYALVALATAWAIWFFWQRNED